MNHEANVLGSFTPGDMIAAGIERPPLSAAHHIVADGATGAAGSRTILEDFGIGINDADNGVFLSSNKLAAMITGSQAAVHSTLYIKNYYRIINNQNPVNRDDYDILQYDAENRLVKKGTIAYTYDRDGNLLSERGPYREAKYAYTEQNRMEKAIVKDVISGAAVESRYAYDGLGRRTMSAGMSGAAVRTLYDGLGFEVIREAETFVDGSLTTRFSREGPVVGRGTEGERYRWLGEDSGGVRTRNLGGAVIAEPYRGSRAALYGRGEAVAVSASTGGRGGTAYLGKDALGSVRSATNGNGALEGRYEYDAFGKPYTGDLSGGMNLGYTGKPYDALTGLYDYGYRDYQPQVARFTTVDPVRDGANWFAYVNNDPVNYIDLWGLKASDVRALTAADLGIVFDNSNKSSGTSGFSYTPLSNFDLTLTDGENSLRININIGGFLNDKGFGSSIKMRVEVHLGPISINANTSVRLAFDMSNGFPPSIGISGTTPNVDINITIPIN